MSSNNKILAGGLALAATAAAVSALLAYRSVSAQQPAAQVAPAAPAAVTTVPGMPPVVDARNLYSETNGPAKMLFERSGGGTCELSEPLMLTLMVAVPSL